MLRPGEGLIFCLSQHSWVLHQVGDVWVSQGGASTYKEDVKAPWFSHAALGFCHISVLACPMMSEFWLACGKQQEIYAFALFSLVIDIYLAGGLDLCCIANNHMKTIITIWRLWGHNKKKLGPDWNLSTTTEKHFYYAVLTVTAIRWQYELLIFKSKSKLQFAVLKAYWRI